MGKAVLKENAKDEVFW